jgi:hypothetical protein
MNTFDIILLNVVFYMGGILSGLGFCFKYKKHLLLKTTSHEQLNEILNTMNGENTMTTQMGPPVSAPVAFASAPTNDQLKEVVIRTN